MPKKMCKCLWGTSVKKNRSLFPFRHRYVYRCSCRRDHKKWKLYPPGFTNCQRLRQMRKWQDWENSKSCLQDLYKIQKLAGNIWKIQDLAGNIWKIQNPSGKTRKIQDLAGKILNFQYLFSNSLIIHILMTQSACIN